MFLAMALFIDKVNVKRWLISACIFNMFFLSGCLVGMASWFGVALAISIILSKKDKNDYDVILDLSTKVEIPASFFRIHCCIVDN